MVERVEDHHARGDRDAIGNGLPAIRIAAKNEQGGFLHDGSPFFERCMASSQPRRSAEHKTFHLVNFVGPR